MRDTLYDMAIKEMLEARADLTQAENNFNYAELEYFEIANEQLTIARARYNVAIQKIKMLG